MDRSLWLYIQYDDDTPPGQAPFTNDASTWDLTDDFFIKSGLDQWFVNEVLGWDSHNPRANSPASRGIPAPHNVMCIRPIVDEEFVGWITGREIRIALSETPKSDNTMSRATSLLVNTVLMLCDLFGDERVRILFAII